MKPTKDITGICPIIATPFTPDGEVDYDSLVNLLRSLAKGGCDGLTLFGIAGEYYKLNDAESRRMVEITVRECRAAGVPSIISVTEHSTKLAAEQAREWQAAGADCLMLLPPFFLKPGAAAIRAHIAAVARAVDIPIMVQYAPEQTGVGIDPAVFAAIFAEFPHVCHYKIECRPPGSYISKFLGLTQNKAGVFIGNAGFQIIECHLRGAIGAMPGCSMWDIYIDIWSACKRGDYAAATRTHTSLLGMLNHIRQDVEQIIHYEKRILHRRGLIATPHCRIPSFTPDPVYDELFESHYQTLEPLFTKL